MSTAQSTATTGTQWKPNDAWLIGIVLAVIKLLAVRPDPP